MYFSFILPLKCGGIYAFFGSDTDGAGGIDEETPTEEPVAPPAAVESVVEISLFVGD